MNRLFLIALLMLITDATAAHAGYYDRVPKSKVGRNQQTQDQWQRDFQRQMMQRQQMQNQMEWQDDAGQDFFDPTN